LGFIGLLIFVGAQMEQSQKIALAAKQLARTEVLVEIIGWFDEGDSSFVEYMYGIVNGTYSEDTTTVRDAL
jgi:hypothetical protein